MKDYSGKYVIYTLSTPPTTMLKLKMLAAYLDDTMSGIVTKQVNQLYDLHANDLQTKLTETKASHLFAKILTKIKENKK